ncbi:hypothetical protein B0H13DRAFT_1867711 [Mycena leptocephala]|nr:hypothetical protein B0H13DRAFT_1867711 [Mycena leptocephala]
MRRGKWSAWDGNEGEDVRLKRTRLPDQERIGRERTPGVVDGAAVRLRGQRRWCARTAATERWRGGHGVAWWIDSGIPRLPDSVGAADLGPALGWARDGVGCGRGRPWHGQARVGREAFSSKPSLMAYRAAGGRRGSRVTHAQTNASRRVASATVGAEDERGGGSRSQIATAQLITETTCDGVTFKWTDAPYLYMESGMGSARKNTRKICTWKGDVEESGHPVAVKIRGETEAPWVERMGAQGPGIGLGVAKGHIYTLGRSPMAGVDGQAVVGGQKAEKMRKIYIIPSRN